jgi:NADH-quinone oxidoreductase subunit A
MDSEIVLSSIIFISIALVIPIAFHLTSYLGFREKNGSSKNEPYESGIDSVIGDANSRFSIKYYLIAISFVVFDVEVVFMYPWAVNLAELGAKGIIEMFLFMSILIIGLYYILIKKVLNWAQE